ncbi:hypothetical protein AVEN_38777-1, partial [Araneus ventricosus]
AVRNNMFSAEVEIQDITKKWLMHAKDRDGGRNLRAYQGVHFQWISSHVDIHGNELADNLAKKGSSHPIPSSSEITFLELFAWKKAQNKAEWLVPSSDHWYKGRKP